MLRRFLLWNLCLTLIFAPLPFLLGKYLSRQREKEPKEVRLQVHQQEERSDEASSREPVKHKIVVYKDTQGIFRLIVVAFTQQDHSPETPAASRFFEGEDLLETIILSQAHAYRLDSNLVKAVIKVESNFDAEAVSTKGAQGFMQLMPATATILGVADPMHPAQNIAGGVKYLRSLLDQFQGDLTLALAAYNAGPAAVQKWQGVPPFPETEEYIRKVKKFYRLFSADSFSSCGQEASLLMKRRYRAIHPPDCYTPGQ